MDPTHSIRNFVYSIFKRNISDQDAINIFLKFSKKRNYTIRQLEEEAAQYLQTKKKLIS